MKVSFWDFLSVLIIAATVILIVLIGIIFINPTSSLNPFPYPTMPARIILPTFTPTLYTLPPTWTPTPQITATPNP